MRRKIVLLSFTLLVVSLFLTACGKVGIIAGNTYMDNQKYFFQITKKSDDFFFNIESNEKIKISADEITGVWVFVVPSSSKLFDRNPKNLLKKFIPYYKKNMNEMKVEKDKNGWVKISGVKAYRAVFLGDIGWKPTKYVFWGLVRPSGDTAFVLVGKALVGDWPRYKRAIVETARSFSLLRK